MIRPVLLSIVGENFVLVARLHVILLKSLDEFN